MSDKNTVNDLLAQLDRIEPIVIRRISFFYFIGLMVVAAFMIILPLQYAALIGLTGYGMYFHAVYSLPLLKDIRPYQLFLLLYVGPLIAGLSLIVFMIKPFFAKSIERSDPLPLSPEQEAVLFAYVIRLARIVGAPQPAEIRVDMQVNASAQLIGGFVGFLRRKLRLTIGLPLVSGMSVAQFSGILAHELGHFSQGAGMRVSNIITSINIWFARMVYEPDSWDDYLKRGMEGSGCLLSLTLRLSRLLIGLTRWILWVLMAAGRMVSCFFLRQMEYDADRKEILFSGSAEFRKTTKNLWLLMLAELKTKEDIGRLHQEEDRLLDNWRDAIAYHSQHIEREELKAFFQENGQKSTGFFDTHPTDKNRLAQAEKLQAAGLFASDLPAAVLFTDFSELSKVATIHFYEMVFGEKIDPKKLISLTEFEKRRQKFTESQQALATYFENLFCTLRPIPLTDDALMDKRSHQELMKEIQFARQTMKKLAAQYETSLKEYDALDDRMLIVSAALTLTKSGVRYTPQKLNLKNAQFETVYQELLDIRESMRSLEARLTPFESAAAARITRTLQLLRSSYLKEILKDSGAMQQKVEVIFSSMKRFFPVFVSLRDFRYVTQQAYVLLRGYEDGLRENEKYMGELNEKIHELRKQLEILLFDLESVSYLFEHAEGEINV